MIRRSDAREHVVQFYGSDLELHAHNVARYFSDGLACGDDLLMVATPERVDALFRNLDRLGVDSRAAVRLGKLTILDAQNTLDRFWIDGQIDAAGFDDAVSPVVAGIRSRPGHSTLRAYGEMVGVLWGARQFSAAARLEQLWNRLLNRCAFKLFCAYPIDVFGGEFQTSTMDALLREHTHLMPANPNGAFEHAIDKAVDETFGLGVEEMKLLIKPQWQTAWAALPRAESTILWLRSAFPACAEDVMERARRYYQEAHPVAAPDCVQVCHNS